MTKLKAPSDPDGLREVVTDPSKIKAYFSPEAVADGTTVEFLDSYAAVWAKAHPEAVGDIRTQVQAAMFDMIRDNGGGRKPAVDLANSVSFRGGRPTLLSADGTAAISHGKGAVYNKFAPGAQFEAAYREDDRFTSVGEYCQAIREEARPSSARNRKELLQKLENVRSFQN